MKIIIIFFIAASLFAQVKKIEIKDFNNKSSFYNTDEISNISFNLKDNYKLKVLLVSGEENVFDITSNSTVDFKNGSLNIFTNNSETNISSSTIQSIKFEKSVASPVPFGELIIDETLLKSLDNPWGLDFIDKDNIIFTEREGQLFIFNIPNKSKIEVTGVPKVLNYGQGGLLDVTLHPDFNTNRYVYLSYSSGTEVSNSTAIGRGKLIDNQLVDFEQIFIGTPLVASNKHFGSRIVFDKDNNLYFSIGDRGNSKNAQDSSVHSGGVMRIKDDGSIPEDNPFLNVPKAKKENYTKGNRNIQGMFYFAEKDQVWTIEHGPQGGDELNIAKPGANYGWPLVTFGINYNGTPITEKTSLPGYEDPIEYWVPSVAPCGMELVSYDQEKDEMDIVISTLAGKHIHRLRIVNGKKVEQIRSLEGFARFRDIQLSPDGYLYAVTESPGRLLRLKTK